MTKYKYTFQIKYTEAVLTKQQSETVMVWNYQNADCGLKMNLLCYLLHFSAHFRSLWARSALRTEAASTAVSPVASATSSDTLPPWTSRVTASMSPRPAATISRSDSSWSGPGWPPVSWPTYIHYSVRNTELERSRQTPGVMTYIHTLQRISGAGTRYVSK